MDKTALINNFSRYAHLYDKYSDVQKMAAFELARSIKNDNLSAILEIGCGTGNYTGLLREKFTGAKIRALDISSSMIDVARKKLKQSNIEFIVTDGESHRFKEKFDLITSGACFQWFDELSSAMKKYGQMLKRKGVILFSIFGPRTFHELNTVLKRVLKVNSIDAKGFICRNKLEEMLKCDFKSVGIKEIRYQEDFSSLNALFKTIKYSGTRGSGLPKDIYLSRTLLKKLEDAYLDEFGKICATYQVFICKGEVL